MKEKKKPILALAFAILIGYRIFMLTNNKFVTYSYVLFELFAILIILFDLNFKIKITKEFISVLILELYIIILTIFDRKITYSHLCLFIGEMVICLYITSKKKSKKYEIIDTFSNALTIIFVIDFISVLIALITGEHTNDNFGIIGHKNYHAFFFVLVIGFRVLKNYLKNMVLYDAGTVLISILSFITEIMVRSASGFVSIGLMLFLIYTIPIKRFRWLKMNNVVLILFFISLFLVFGYRNELLINLLNLLGRDAGLTGRATIWNETINLINKEYLFGYGFYKTIRIYSVDLGWIDNHCHNYFLNIFLSGGIIYALAMFVMFYKSGQKIKETRNIYNYLLTIIIFCYLLLGISEIVVNVNGMLFPLLILCTQRIKPFAYKRDIKQKKAFSFINHKTKYRLVY